MNYDTVELNASDTRNKKSVHDFLTDLVQTQSFGASDTPTKRVIIMDEVDGMGGSDRGGMAELLKIMKTSKIPIICICNDRQSQKVKSLANSCLDLRVKRPTKQQIAARLIAICKEESVAMDMNAAELLVEQVGNDIRQAINAMQMWKINGDEVVTYIDMKSGMSRIEKDKVLRQSPFDACNSILGGDKMSLNDRYNSFFIDYSLVPLLVQQNYIDSAKSGLFKKPSLSEIDRLNLLSDAADAASDMALAGSSIMGQDQHWELLPVQAAFSVRVGSIVNGFQPFPTFPAWLGKYSSTSKRKRLVTDVVHHTSLAVGQTFNPIRLDYTPYLRSILIDILLHFGVEKMVEIMDDYGLSKDDFSETFKELQFEIENDKVLTDRFRLVDSKLKASFTRYYNSIVHKSQTLVTEITGMKKSKKISDSGGDGVIYDEDGAIVDEGVVEELDEDDGEKEEDIRLLLASKKKSQTAKKAPNKPLKLQRSQLNPNLKDKIDAHCLSTARNVSLLKQQYELFQRLLIIHLYLYLFHLFVFCKYYVFFSQRILKLC